MIKGGRRRKKKKKKTVISSITKRGKEKRSTILNKYRRRDYSIKKERDESASPTSQPGYEEGTMDRQ